MPERVVVSFRGEIAEGAGGEAAYLQRALGIKKRAEALGATLCAWSAQTFSFDLAPDEIEEAITLAALATEGDDAQGQRFGAAIAQGSLGGVGEGGSLAVLSWGRPLIRAVALARIARPGEVLVDPELPALESGELLTLGTRIAVDRGKRIRGVALDARQPWRREAAVDVARLVEPALVGRDATVSEIAVPLGCIGIIRADHGAGGTRLLAELVSRLAPSRALFVSPVRASREPLGAVRRALARSSAKESAPAIPEALRGALDRLLEGVGVDPWSAAELLDTWLAPAHGRYGVLAIDDANELDAASLDAIATAIHVRGGFRILARLPADEPMPAAFGSIPAAPPLHVGALSARDAARLSAAFADGAISEVAVARWARRGGGAPLGLFEALAAGIASGELSFRTGAASPRKRSSGRGRPEPAEHWIEQRARTLRPGERAALTALAMLGGDASIAMVDALATAMAGRDARWSSIDEALRAGAWVRTPEPGWISLRSRTATAVLSRLLPPEEQIHWHRAASATIEQHGGVLGRGDAAWHAAAAGDHESATRLAVEAAAAAARASLENAAASLRAFAQAQRKELVDEAEELDAADVIEEPVSLSEDGRTTVPPEAGGRPRFDTLLDDHAVAAAAAAALAAAGRSEPHDSLQMTTESPTLGPARLAELAKEALVQGDVAALEGLIAELRATGEYPELVARMSGLVALGRGAKSEALGKLRAAAEVVDQPASHRARARLAYGVALAAAGRGDAALLEALEALARAREASDRQGEHACARFLARLSAAAGHAAAAGAWGTAAKQTSG